MLLQVVRPNVTTNRSNSQITSKPEIYHQVTNDRRD